MRASYSMFSFSSALTMTSEVLMTRGCWNSWGKPVWVNKPPLAGRAGAQRGLRRSRDAMLHDRNISLGSDPTRNQQRWGNWPKDYEIGFEVGMMITSIGTWLEFGGVKTVMGEGRLCCHLANTDFEGPSPTWHDVRLPCGDLSFTVHQPFGKWRTRIVSFQFTILYNNKILARCWHVLFERIPLFLWIIDIFTC